VVLVKEITTGDDTYPDYKNSMFKPENSSLPIYFEDKKTFKMFLPLMVELKLKLKQWLKISC
jgi:hypothetical protein